MTQRLEHGRFGGLGLRGALLLALAAAVAGAGCARRSADWPEGTPKWEMKLLVDGEEVRLPLEIMDIFLVENKAHAETFEIRGPGVLLAGEFPGDLHVGYEEKLTALVDREIALQPRGAERGHPQDSTLALPGKAEMAVVGGSFVVEEVSGRWAGVKGDRTVSGRISIQVQDAAGPRTLDGTFSVHAVTWG